MANTEEFNDDAELTGFMADPNEVDPVSGNEIPLGATAEGVRDDQTAAISPGEFVIPDYAVRYHGLDFYVDSLQQAQQGLQQMEGMGLVGNPDEQTIPDEAPLPTMPMQSPEEEPQMGFQTGGLTTVPLQQPQQQTVAPPMLPQSQIIQPARPVSTQPIPTAQPAPQSSYLDLQGYTVDPYINEAGNIIYLTSMGGRVQGGIPPGYRKAEPKDLAYSPQPVSMERTSPTPTVTDSQLRQPEAGFDPDRGALPDDGPQGSGFLSIDPSINAKGVIGAIISAVTGLPVAAFTGSPINLDGRTLSKAGLAAFTREGEKGYIGPTSFEDVNEAVVALTNPKNYGIDVKDESQSPLGSRESRAAVIAAKEREQQLAAGRGRGVGGPSAPDAGFPGPTGLEGTGGETGQTGIDIGYADKSQEGTATTAEQTGIDDTFDFGSLGGEGVAPAGTAGDAAAAVAERDPGIGTLWKKGGLVSKKRKQKKGSKGLASV